MPLKVLRQDITKISCDAVVNSTNPSMIPDGGADLALHRAAGSKFSSYCANLGGCAEGETQITPGFSLPCKYVIHTVCPVWDPRRAQERSARLETCYFNCLKRAMNAGCTSLALPLLGTGLHGFPKEVSLKIAIKVVGDLLLKHEMLVYLTVYDGVSFAVCEKVLEVQSYIDDRYVETHSASRCREQTCFDLATPSFQPLCPGAPASPDRSAKSVPPVGLESMLKDMDKGFAETLFFYIDKKGMTDVECYKRANVDKKTFSKIKCNPKYRPGKVTAVSFALALRLNLSETEHLLRTAGMSLSRSNKFDIIIEYFITSGDYKTIFDVNEVLYQFDQVLLGV